MIAWMIYVLVITLILSVAALLAEHAARQLRIPGRWIWAVAIVSSLLIPTVVSSISIQLPNPFTPAVTQQLIVLRDTASVRLPILPLVQTRLPATPPPAVAANWDDLLKHLWIAASCAIFLFLAASGAVVMLLRRTWVKAHIDGVPVLVAANIGPAVVGLLRPQIVVPAWLEKAPLTQQNMVIEHEQAHLDACDPQLLSVALCLLISMPWNLPLWWQLHRLRRAIEVDCDARVVRRGKSGDGKLAAYGETLLAVGQRQSGFIGVAAAMSESASFLEQRIGFLLHKPAKWNRTAAAFLGGLAIAAFVVATDISPPNAADADFDAYDHIELPSSVIDGYVGNYLLNDHSILTVSNHAGHMVARVALNLLRPLAITQTSFNTQTLKLRMTFIPDAQGRASAVLFHYKGQDVIRAPRIDDALAQQINDRIISHINSQAALPGSETALRRMIAQLSATPPNYAESGLSPQLVGWFQNQEPIQRPRTERLGAMQSMEFVGVNEKGWDKYLVRYEHGSMQWAVALDQQGLIAGVAIDP